LFSSSGQARSSHARSGIKGTGWGCGRRRPRGGGRVTPYMPVLVRAVTVVSSSSASRWPTVRWRRRVSGTGSLDPRLLGNHVGKAGPSEGGRDSARSRTLRGCIRRGRSRRGPVNLWPWLTPDPRRPWSRLVLRRAWGVAGSSSCSPGVLAEQRWESQKHCRDQEPCGDHVVRRGLSVALDAADRVVEAVVRLFEK